MRQASLKVYLCLLLFTWNNIPRDENEKSEAGEHKQGSEY